MAKKKTIEKNDRKNFKEKSLKPKLKTETQHGILAVIFFVLALLLLMSAFGGAGVAGDNIYNALYMLLGYGYVLLPILFILLGFSFIKKGAPTVGSTKLFSSLLFLLSGLGILDAGSSTHAGGFLGRILGTPLVKLFDVYASMLFLVALLMISILAMFDTRPELITFAKKIWGWLTNKKENEEDEEKVKLVTGEEDDEEDEEDKISVQEKLKKAFTGEKKGPTFAKTVEEEEEMPIKKRKVTFLISAQNC